MPPVRTPLKEVYLRYDNDNKIVSGFNLNHVVAFSVARLPGGVSSSGETIQPSITLTLSLVGGVQLAVSFLGESSKIEAELADWVTRLERALV